MARKAPIITLNEFREKFANEVKKTAIRSEEYDDDEDVTASSLYVLNYFHGKVSSDLQKINFDFENYYTPGTPENENRDTSDSYVRPEEKGVVGFNVLPSGIPFLGAWAGGDWEYPVYFMIYWDGKSLRGYVPTVGNTFCEKYKTAYGSEGNADNYNEEEHHAWVKKTFGVELNAVAWIADANARIEVK